MRSVTRAAWSLGVTLALCSGLSAQDPVPPVDPALPAQLKDLKDLVDDRKMLGDFEAMGMMQRLSKGLEERNPKDKEKIAKAIGDVFKTGKVRPPENLLYREAGDALAKFGEDGAKEIAKALTNKRIKDQIALQAHLALALGRTEDEDQVDWLVDTATRSPHDELRAAAGEALGNYTSLDARPRREAVKKLIREWGSLHSSATTPESNDPNGPIDMGPQNARRTLRAVESKWRASLAKLTGVDNSEFPEWQRWLNKNQNWPIPEAPKKADSK